MVTICRNWRVLFFSLRALLISRVSAQSQPKYGRGLAYNTYQMCCANGIRLVLSMRHCCTRNDLRRLSCTCKPVPHWVLIEHRNSVHIRSAFGWRGSAAFGRSNEPLPYYCRTRTVGWPCFVLGSELINNLHSASVCVNVPLRMPCGRRRYLKRSGSGVSQLMFSRINASCA